MYSEIQPDRAYNMNSIVHIIFLLCVSPRRHRWVWEPRCLQSDLHQSQRRLQVRVSPRLWDGPRKQNLQGWGWGAGSLQLLNCGSLSVEAPSLRKDAELVIGSKCCPHSSLKPPDPAVWSQQTPTLIRPIHSTGEPNEISQCSCNMSGVVPSVCVCVCMMVDINIP